MWPALHPLSVQGVWWTTAVEHTAMPGTAALQVWPGLCQQHVTLWASKLLEGAQHNATQTGTATVHASITSTTINTRMQRICSCCQPAGADSHSCFSCPVQCNGCTLVGFHWGPTLVATDCGAYLHDCSNCCVLSMLCCMTL